MSNNGLAVQLRDVVLRFGDVAALDGVNIDIAPGSLVTLLGPSGSGKTTALRVLAGLARPDSGDVLLGGRRVNDIPARERDQAMVFENYALFPRRSVFDNVAFGLVQRGTRPGIVKERVSAALAEAHLPDRERAMPEELSRGQQQCVALARALALRPALWLFDDPFAAMDDRLRAANRRDFRRVQRACGITTVLATHDQSEALAVSDQLVVINRGRIEQVGTPEAVYTQPASAFVAGFMGQTNILPGKVVGQAGECLRVEVAETMEILARPARGNAWRTDEPVHLVLRTERLQLTDDRAPPDGQNRFAARITAVEYRGSVACYGVAIGDVSLEAINPVSRRPYPENAQVTVHVDPEDCVLLPGSGN